MSGTSMAGRKPEIVVLNGLDDGFRWNSDAGTVQVDNLSAVNFLTECGKLAPDCF